VTAFAFSRRRRDASHAIAHLCKLRHHLLGLVRHTVLEFNCEPPHAGPPGRVSIGASVRDHLAEAVGAALVTTMLGRRWLMRIEGTRAVSLTQRGSDGLYRTLGLEIEP
jgi:hypothetical protein